MVDASSQHDATEFSDSVGVQTPSSILGLTSAKVSIATQTSPERPFIPTHSRRASTSSVLDDTLLEDDEADDDITRVSSDFSQSLSKLNLSTSESLPKTTPLLHSHDLPPSYAHLEAEEMHRVRQEAIQRWHPGMATGDATPLTVEHPPALPSSSSTPVISTAVPPSPLEGIDLDSLDDVSREAVEKWKNLKREMGFECLAIDRALLSRKRSSASVRSINDASSNPFLTAKETGTMTPRLAREWASQVQRIAEAEEEEDTTQRKGKGVAKATGRAQPAARSPRRHFYDAYKSLFYPDPETAEEDESPKRNWGVMLTGVGVWALVMMTGKHLIVKSSYSSILMTSFKLL